MRRMLQKKFITEQQQEKVVETARYGKLSEDEVRELRLMAKLGASTMECGLAFDISQKSAWAVIAGKSWRNVK